MNRSTAQTLNCREELQNARHQFAICNSQFAILQGAVIRYAFVITYLLLMLQSSVWAAIDADRAVSDGARALDSWWDYPWYNDETDAVRRINVKEDSQPAPPKQAPVSGGPRRDFGWLGWTLLALVAVGMIFMLARAYWNRSREPSGSGKAGLVGSAASVDRLEDLPFPLEQQDGDLLSAARRAAEQGSYDHAIVLLYSHQLLELDRQEAIRLTKGKTNRQYLRELRQRPDLGRLLSTSMIAFEDVFFGAHSLDRQRFEECWEHARQLLAASQVREAA